MTAPTIPTLPARPAVNAVATRVFDRLPEAYRTFDAQGGYPFLLYIDALTQKLGDVDIVVERIRGQRPVGPASPEPWSLHPDYLAAYRANRVYRTSDLGDPLTADAAWLPWLVQFVGGTLDPAASVAEQRDTIRYATSGWMAGTRQTIEYAARSVLSGTQYARVIPHQLSDGTPGGPWDVVILTRATETPSPQAVLDAIARKGVKPAGVVLHHRQIEATWNVIEAVRPTWSQWENDAQGVVTWNRFAETGLSYASVPGNLVPNASYEANVTGWTVGANTTQTWIAGGIDGLGQARLTATALGQVSQASGTGAVTAGQDYRVACSVKPNVTRTGRIRINWSTGATTTGPDVSFPANTWTRTPPLTGTAPAGATTLSVSVLIDALAAAETVAVDAWDARHYTG
jgi:hypothetical protein